MDSINQTHCLQTLNNEEIMCQYFVSCASLQITLLGIVYFPVVIPVQISKMYVCVCVCVNLFVYI